MLKRLTMNNDQLKNLAAHAGDYVKFETPRVITWCSGCGNFGIVNALKRAFVQLGIGRKDCLLCFDVGCCGNGADKIEAYTIHGLHGRVLSLAAGAKIGNPRLNVVAVGGDGGTFSEGVNHLVHSVRNNYPFLFILHNNENYGLTTGQPSSLTRKGAKMLAAPHGVVVDPINAAQFVLSLSPSFVARGYSGNVDEMTDIFAEALQHKGFAFVEILQACPTYNKLTPDEWYAGRVKNISSLAGYDRGDIWQARRVCEDMDKDIYTGVLYVDKERKDFLSVQVGREACETGIVDEVRGYSVAELY